ncbi:hypothetical protein BV898_18732 [Hypsibius exemplaris]|uniref:Uncharacterized protein n=1 Tax=Hypsibius exemplaris TaxID=2072580 RepID=A0A9X6NQM1_HYPEX|nr:hypothetical protein BV898_18732 [Hypsibius exemplaris]
MTTAASTGPEASTVVTDIVKWVEQHQHSLEKQRNIARALTQTMKAALQIVRHPLLVTRRISRIEEDCGLRKGSNEIAPEGGAVSDARAPKETIPLEILDPKGLERKNEDALFKSGVHSPG